MFIFSQVSRSLRPIRADGAFLLFLLLTVAPLGAGSHGAAGSGAQADPSAASVRFEIESIDVEGSQRVSTSLIAAQSLLVPGESYTERELRDAAARVQRLPFVLEAEPSLRRGSARGTYELVFEIVETSRFFVSYGVFGAYRPSRTLDISGLPGTDPTDGPEIIEIPSDADISSESLDLGFRLFQGARGVFFVATDVGLGLTAGYTRYQLFGTSSFLTVAVRRLFCCDDASIFVSRGDFSRDNEVDATEISVSLGVPIRGNHSLQFELTGGSSDDRLRVFDDIDEPTQVDFVDVERRTYGLDARWIYDSTDDPILPTFGEKLAGGFGFGRGESEAGRAADARSFDQRLFFLEGSRYRRLGKRGVWSVAAGARHSISDSPFGALTPATGDNEATSLFGNLGYALQLRRSGGGVRRGELRLETFAQYSATESSSDSFSFSSDDVAELNTSLVYRNRFALLRFSFSYVELVDR